MKNEMRRSLLPRQITTDREALRKTLMEIAEEHAQEQIDYFNQLFAELRSTNGTHQNV